MKILNFGSLNIDYVYSVDDIVKPGCTIAARFMRTREIDVHLPCYDHYYKHTPIDKKMIYVEEIKRDELMTDLIRKLTDM